MKSFTFYVDGRPRGKGRPRLNTKTRRIYTPAAAKQRESEIRQAFIRQGGESFCGVPVMVRYVSYHPMPKSWSEKQRDEARGTYADRKPDLDNQIKLLDGLNGVAWDDDKSVVAIVAKKVWADHGGVEITITDMSE